MWSVHLLMHDHFETIDQERQRRGDRSLHEELIDLLVDQERKSGTTSRILAAQAAIRKALGQRGVKTLLEYERLMTDRTIDAERLAYNLGHEHGLVRGRAQQVEDPAERELAVEIGDLLVRVDLDERVALRAMANVLAGLASR